MKRLLLPFMILVLAGCSQSSENYSSELSNELPKPREGSPEFEPIKPAVKPGGPTRAGK